jgi:thiosulfate dehydrogenase [quinone] large subunit
MNGKARYIWALARITLGWYFFWAFLDKLFGLGRSTGPENAWLAGGSPTALFLGEYVRGPLGSFYQSLAGSAVVDWLFMAGLLGLGTALMLGIGMRIASYAGGLLMLLMWSSRLPPGANPIVDEHIIFALLMSGLWAARAGRTLGLGNWWAEKVKKVPILE